ncbi:MAG: serine/threonine-protein kinase [Streptosporangiaceae bacterium]
MGDGDTGAVGFVHGFFPGSRIAGYRLGEQIGRGGMAVVFRAQDERHERQVALKILSPALAADETFQHRFILESRSAAAVDDPYIIPVFEAGEADGVLFIAMRYVPGGDVDALLKQTGPLPAERVAAIISGVASALDTAHAAGLVHRDVKPTNMLLDTRVGRPDHVYLSDFGLSKGALSSADLTGVDCFMGTLHYCAPEQIQGRRVDARSDEYALACTAFELLSGRPPFSQEEASAVLYAQLKEPPPRLAPRRADLPAAVDDVLLRALAKAPEERYASCGEFADALRMALGLQRYAPDVATVLHQRTLADQHDGLRTDAPAAPSTLSGTGEEAGSPDHTPLLPEQIVADQPDALEPERPDALEPDRPDQPDGLEPDHPDALAARFSLAQEMAAQGDHAEAEEEFRYVYRARQRALGPNHPETLIARFGAAQEIAARGDHARAEEEFRGMLPHQRRSLGRYHPDTLATGCSIAREMAARGDHAGAEQEFRDVLAYLQRKPGLDHPVTVILWLNIAKEMVARGDHAGAEEEFRDLLPHLKLTLGRDHPDTLAALEWIDYLERKRKDRPAEPRRHPRADGPAAMPAAHPGGARPGRGGVLSAHHEVIGRHEHGSAQPGAAGR